MTYQAIPPAAGGAPVAGNSVWARQQATFIGSLIPTLTTYQYIKAGQEPLGLAAATMATNDGAAEGGGRTAANATLTYIAPAFQTPNTGKWAFGFRVKFLAAGAGQTNAVGLFNAAGTHDVLVGAINSVSGTNYALELDGTTATTDDTGMANDLAFHTFVVTGDATNVKAYIDGTLKATRAIGTNVVDEPTFLGIYNTATTETVYTDCIYAFIQ